MTGSSFEATTALALADPLSGGGGGAFCARAGEAATTNVAAMADDALRAIRPLTRAIRFRSIILPSILAFTVFFERVFERAVEGRILKLGR
jgi:hypothetical protein